MAVVVPNVSLTMVLIQASEFIVFDFFQMDPAGTKVMLAVGTPKGTMAMEVVVVSSLNQPHFLPFFFSMFHSDGSQDQGSQGQQGQKTGSQGQQTGCTSIFFTPSFLSNLLTYAAGGGFMSKAKGMLHDFKEGGNGKRGSGGGYTQPGNEGDY